MKADGRRQGRQRQRLVARTGVERHRKRAHTRAHTHTRTHTAPLNLVTLLELSSVSALVVFYDIWQLLYLSVKVSVGVCHLRVLLVF